VILPIVRVKPYDLTSVVMPSRKVLIARAESIRFEIQTRDDSHEYGVTSEAIMAKLALSDPANIAKRLANVCRAAELADAKITNLFRNCCLE
jgi:hypothetical protein